MLGLRADRFPTQQFTQTLPTIWGRHYLSGFFMTPIFNSRNEIVEEKIKAGKKTQTVPTGYLYFGSYALALCFGGAIDELTQIQYVENDLLSAEETPSDANTPLTISTDVGDFILYPGGSSQPVPTELADLGTQPGYRNISYIVLKDVNFGTQPSPPNLLFLVKRYPNQLTLTTHSVSEDAVLPEVIYDVLVNTVYGMGMNPGSIDKASFESIAEDLIVEGHGVSPVLDGEQDVKQFLVDLLQYSDLAFGRDTSGRITLNRLQDAQAKAIDPNAFLDRLDREVAQWSETWVETRLEFSDREAKGETRTVTYHDLAAEVNAGHSRYREFRRPFFTRVELAHKHASQLGRAGGIPEVRYRGVLNRSYSSLRPGEVVTFEYEGSSKRVLVTDVEVGGPKDPRVRFEGIVDRSYLKRRPTAVTDFIFNPATLTLSSSVFRMATLPDALKNGAQDGLLIAAARPSDDIDGGIVSFAFDSSGEWWELGQVTVFALAAQVNSWRHINAQYIALDITFDNDADNTSFVTAVGLGNHRFLQVVSCYRDVVTTPAADQHSMDPTISIIRPGSVPTPHPSDARRWLIDIESGLFGTQPYRFMESGVDGRYPTSRCFIGVENAFLRVPLPNWNFERALPNDTTDTDLIRYVRLQTKTPKQIQPEGAAAIINLDRDLTTMNPDGTYAPDWNELSTPSHDDDLGTNILGHDVFYTPGLTTAIKDFRSQPHAFNALYAGSWKELVIGGKYIDRNA